jgi:5-formyltetrahydrofolate cyclo-ligase
MSLEVSVDPELVVRAKRQLRTRMRALRSAIPRAALDVRSRAIVDRLFSLPSWSAAQRIALFAPLLEQGEVDVRDLDARARAAGKEVYYPGVDPAGQPAFRVSTPEMLEERGAGYPEPPPSAPGAAPGQIELVIVPALAADERGLRLGYGSGFYDVALAQHAPRDTIVVVYDFQLLAEVPALGHDVPCDAVVTDARVVRVRSGEIGEVTPTG